MITTIDATPFVSSVPSNLGGFMSEYERALLVSLARIVQPVRVLEIGLQMGQAARMLLDNVPSILDYVGVDTYADYVPGIDAQAKAHERPTFPGELVMGDPRFTRVLHPRGSFDLQPSKIGKFDMVIIDGDHSKVAVLHDTKIADLVVNSWGVIVWHDYGAWCEDINEVLDERGKTHNLCHAVNTMLVWEMVE